MTKKREIDWLSGEVCTTSIINEPIDFNVIKPVVVETARQIADRRWRMDREGKRDEQTDPRRS